jgi:hypothetical protein
MKIDWLVSSLRILKYVFLISPIYTTCTANSILPDFITLIICLAGFWTSCPVPVPLRVYKSFEGSSLAHVSCLNVAVRICPYSGRFISIHVTNFKFSLKLGCSSWFDNDNSFNLIQLNSNIVHLCADFTANYNWGWRQ